MPVVSTDDQARRLRYIYLGPVGFRFPFDARFPAIGFWLACTAAGILLSVAFSPPGTRLGLVGGCLSPVVAALVARKVMRHVDHDRPLRWWMQVVTGELATPRPVDHTPTTVTVTPTADLITRS